MRRLHCWPASFMAAIPVATVIFRYNNPDALLTLLVIGIVYSTLEAVDSSRFRWLLLAGVLTGAAFLTKQLQVLLVLPSVGATYLVFARTSMVRRFLQLLGALGAALLAGGWWLLLVQLTSPANRPFIGGSRHNSVIELTLGYNGLDRLTGVDASRTMSVDVTGPVGQCWMSASSASFTRSFPAKAAGFFHSQLRACAWASGVCGGVRDRPRPARSSWHAASGLSAPQL